MWQFNRDGTWQEGPKLTDAEQWDASELYKSNGYEKTEGWGSPAADVELWEKHDGGESRYIVVLGGVNTWKEVFCSDTPAFLEFMRLHGYAWIQNENREEIRQWVDDLHDLLTHPSYGVFSAWFRQAARDREHYLRPKPAKTAG